MRPDRAAAARGEEPDVPGLKIADGAGNLGDEASILRRHGYRALDSDHFLDVSQTKTFAQAEYLRL